MYGRFHTVEYLISVIIPGYSGPKMEYRCMPTAEKYRVYSQLHGRKITLIKSWTVDLNSRSSKPPGGAYYCHFYHRWSYIRATYQLLPDWIVLPSSYLPTPAWLNGSALELPASSCLAEWCYLGATYQLLPGWIVLSWSYLHATAWLNSDTLELPTSSFLAE